MKLFEHPDFEQAILRAVEYFRDQGLRAAIIEKDYYVTEVLRLIATAAPAGLFSRVARACRKAGISSRDFRKTSISSSIHSPLSQRSGKTA